MVTDQKLRPVSPCFPPLAHSLRRKKKYLHSSWFKLKSKSYITCTAADIFEAGIFEMRHHHKGGLHMSKGTGFLQLPKTELKRFLYAQSWPIFLGKKKKKETKQNPSTYSTACSQIPYLELLECRLKQFTREKGNTNTVHAPLTSTAVKWEQSSPPEYLHTTHTEGYKKSFTRIYLWPELPCIFRTSLYLLVKNATLPYLQDIAKIAINLFKS